MKKPIILILILTLLVSPSFSQKELPPEGGKPRDFVLPEKKVKTLSNGLKSTSVHYGNIPKVNISLIIKTGNVHENDDQVWLADLTGNLLKQGTREMDFKTISDTVATMGGEVNIKVGEDQTTISGAVLSEFAPDFLNILAKLIMNPAFPESELDRLKAGLKRQLAVQKAVPQMQGREKFRQVVYKNSPYARFFPSPEMIDSYTGQMVKNFYDQNFGAKRSVLYIVGNFDGQAVDSAIQQAFSDWRAGPEISYPQDVAVTNSERFIIERQAAPQTTILLGLPTIGPQDANYVKQIVANSLLGGSFGSRITSNIRENKGYTYSPSSNIQNVKGGSVWMEVADVTSEHTIDALREIEKEIKRLQNEPPSTEELNGIKNYEAGNFVLRNSLPSGIISQLNFLDLYNLPDSYLSNMVKNIHAVTPTQVSEIAKKYFPYNKMTLVMVGDKEAIEQQAKK